ncbi:hypothetical protein [Phenylobacterium sp.]|uniref:hypothetical protein n=1 Tax=Phenylobacterium sp. TaxID=1871053 RepID=UPI0025D6254A|nr:hypothetical protein [Phenylobacterium sp.]
MSRVDRVAGRGLRERDRKLRAAEHRRATRGEADAYEALIERLTKIHQVGFERFDWEKIEAIGPVVPNVARDAVSAVARQRLANYRPSLLDNLLGREREKRRELTNEVVESARADAELYARAKAEAAAHNKILALAGDVRSMKPEAIAGVLRANGAATVFKDATEGFSLFGEGRDRLIGQVDLWEYDALPEEAFTAAGVVSRNVLLEAERRQIQLAHACSVTIRAAVELLQVAPVETVEVVGRLCRPGGLAETDTDSVLYLRVSREALAKIQLRKLDAAPAAVALGMQVDWTAARGLAPIRIDDPGIVRVTAARAAA